MMGAPADTPSAPLDASDVWAHDPSVQRRRLRVRGTVQGVGFRPFVFDLAVQRGLAGLVVNTSGSVVIEVEGRASALDAFERELRARCPRLARIDDVAVTGLPPLGEPGFRIEESRAVDGEWQPISPDAATCDDCLRELLDPADRRFGYPFVNCTNCGPRFTIIEDLPYDRRRTTMRRFPMCARCRAEYEDPRDRRFHAQPNACPACGPRLWLAGPDGERIEGDPVTLAARHLGEGAVIAVKGLGGFQLACDASDAAAVARLRRRKHRPSKPFAVMVVDIAMAAAVGSISSDEMAALEGVARPIVLLRRAASPAAAGIAAGVAPGLDELGVMLPTTPLHHLVLRAAGRPLVMTSGNLTEEPIAKDNDEALERLAGIADRFLLHDREIAARYDDSVVRVVDGSVHTVRRARGLCPAPLRVGDAVDGVLATGPHLKSTVCITKAGSAFVGPHIGDLDHPLTRAHHTEALRTSLRLLRSRPHTVACDLHPDYWSTRVAEAWWEQGAAAVQVQHHHAHIASVMAEHGLRGPVLGVAFDGVGHGPDGSIWGGELLRCDERSYARVGHLAAVPQPGGDRCAREGWRMAASYLWAAGGLTDAPPDWMRTGFDDAEAVDPRRWRLVGRIAAAGTAPSSSSAGRLFDAVSSLIGVAHTSSFEGEAAMRLEATARGAVGSVAPLEVAMEGRPLRIDTPGLVARIAADRAAGRPPAELAAVFHESLARAVALASARLAAELDLERVALSGGVFQNVLLLRRLRGLLEERGLRVYTNHAVPANDGGISLGQALVASALAGGGHRPEAGNVASIKGLR